MLAAWSWAHLSAAFGGSDKSGGGGTGRAVITAADSPPVPKWPCLMAPPGLDRFIPCDQEKNIYGSFYHIRVRKRALHRAAAPALNLRSQEPETEARELTFADFAACAGGWRSRRVLLRAALAAPAAPADVVTPGALRSAPAPAPPAASSAEDAVAAAVLPPPAPEVPACVSDELQRLVDWRWLRDAVQAPLRAGRVLRVDLGASSPRALQAARYGRDDVLFCQLRGRSRILLVAPEATFPGLYPYPTAHPYDTMSCVDWAEPNTAEWPAFADVRGQVAILAPGDILLIPRFWWVQIHALGDGCADATSAAAEKREEHTWLEITLAPGGRVRSPGGAAVAASRAVEAIASSLDGGAAKARELLLHVASGADLRPADLHTLAGFKRLRAATAVRDEVALTLGIDALADVPAFLRRMTERRLVATPWLNASFREPLYLKAPPRLEPDTRSEWERRFPELFVRKLQAEGYTPAFTPVSQINPSHPAFVGTAKPSAGAGA